MTKKAMSHPHTLAMLGERLETAVIGARERSHDEALVASIEESFVIIVTHQGVQPPMTEDDAVSYLDRIGQAS